MIVLPKKTPQLGPFARGFPRKRFHIRFESDPFLARFAHLFESQPFAFPIAWRFAPQPVLIALAGAFALACLHLIFDTQPLHAGDSIPNCGTRNGRTRR